MQGERQEDEGGEALPHFAGALCVDLLCERCHHLSHEQGQRLPLFELGAARFSGETEETIVRLCTRATNKPSQSRPFPPSGLPEEDQIEDLVSPVQGAELRFRT